jgi:hypothetical protein
MKPVRLAVMVVLLLVAATVCNAQAATPPPIPLHGVTLGWSPVTGVTGYIVWRGSSTGGPYTPLTTLPMGNFTCTLVCQWQDSNVTSGSTYFYVLTDYVTSGNVTVGSVFSGEVSGTIPADPVVASPAKPAVTPK